MISYPKTLHLSHDNRFVSFFSRQLDELAPGSATYVILAGNSKPKYPVRGDSRIMATAQAAREEVLALMSEYDAVIVHYMFPAWAEIVPTVSRCVPVIWSGFGGDYYGKAQNEYAGLLGPHTRGLRKLARGRETAPGKLHRLWSRRGHQRVLNAAASAVTYFSAPVSADLAVMTARFPGFAGEYLPLNYATAEGMAPPILTSGGENILIGNSATLTNNHLDVFARLAKIDLNGRKLLVPLSYGDGDAYTEAVVSAGRGTFGSDFQPILDPLPLEEYNRILASCSFTMMGHLRQQGLGNILTGLLSGATPVLESANPVARSLREMGIKIATFDDLVRYGLDGVELTVPERATNRELTAAYWSEFEVNGRLEKLLVLLSSGISPTPGR